MPKIRFSVPAWCIVLLLAAAVLTAAAWLRGAEYDEQYTLFLTAGTPRPAWPETVFPAGDVVAVQAGHASLAGIARDLRVSDVHPPFYFWAVSLWRDVFGPSLFAARMLSVVCGLVSISLVGIIARRSAIQPVPVMLLTLGCYGFVYTNAIARGFAPAQMLILCAVALLLRQRTVLAGLCFGAASCCNYLAVFVGAAAILIAGAWPAVLAAIPFLALDGWFFAAQHAARPGQFPPFAFWPSLLRLAEYQTAAVFGGLPMYVDGIGRQASGAAVGLLAVGLVVRIALRRPLRQRPEITASLRLGGATRHGGRRPAIHRFAGTSTTSRRLWASSRHDVEHEQRPSTEPPLRTGPARMILAAALAPPIGLLLLGATFNNTPIELRYLSFGLPFVALLAGLPAYHGRGSAVLHGRLAARFCRLRVPVLPLMMATQLAAIGGLLLAPRTMQPARTTAAEAARRVAEGIVLVPRGNDGVGIVGAFAIEAPAALPILLIRPDDPVAARIAAYHRVVLALMAQDRDSVAAIAVLRASLAPPKWRPVATGSNVEVYERTDQRE